MTTALLDTCVLVPSRARDVLLEIASTGAYQPLWSSEILAELDRTLRLLLAKRGASPEETDAYLTRLLRQMRVTFPDALVTEWEELVPTMTASEIATYLSTHGTPVFGEQLLATLNAAS
jgi:hypothetical protein